MLNLFKKKKIVIKVEGMKCMHCAKSVTESLLKVSNILNVKVNLEKKEVLITYKDTIDIDNIKKNITDLDYQFEGVLNA